ncbi:hypothetical protein DFJ73DRAFT_351567 [Zopfochytrium polystomum]|nr:hypothetical protein DFJ73DRAFT_351567 [Zopfochytrium polystomum]
MRPSLGAARANILRARAAALSRAAHLARRAAASASWTSRPHPIFHNHAGTALPTVTSPSPTLLVAPYMQPVLLDTKALSVLRIVRIVLKSVPSAFRAVYADLFAIAVRAVLRHLLDLLQRNSSARDLTVALECIAWVTPACLPTDDGSFEMAFAERCAASGQPRRTCDKIK